MSILWRSILGCLLLLSLSIPVATAQPSNDTSGTTTGDRRLDSTPVRKLLHLIETIRDENPGYQEAVKRLATLNAPERQDSLAKLVTRNMENPRITGEIESLLASPAYVLYYRQFRNASPDKHRAFFYSLPYYATDGPGGVGDVFYELCRNFDAVAVWYEHIISRIDLQRSLKTAQQWLPRGDYYIPKVYIIYDGMGDAFASDDGICFDLYGVLLSHRPRATRFDNLDDIDVTEVENILAHEIHHVMAYPMLYADPPPDTTWESRWVYRLARRLVSEGAAMHCNPRTGINAAIKDDSTIVRYWIRRVNEKLAAVDAGIISEGQLVTWSDSSYFEIPTQLLIDFLARRYPAANQDSLLQLNMGYKPDMEHTLGWWLVSHISGGVQPGRLIALLSQPDSVFAWYDEAIGSNDPSLLMTVPTRQ